MPPCQPTPRQEEGGSATERDSAQPGSRELLGRAVQSWLRKATVPAYLHPVPRASLRRCPQLSPKPKKPLRRPDAVFSPGTGFQASSSELSVLTRPLSFTCGPPVRSGGDDQW